MKRIEFKTSDLKQYAHRTRGKKHEYWEINQGVPTNIRITGDCDIEIVVHKIGEHGGSITLDSDFKGSVKLLGSGDGNVYREGRGDGDATRLGTGRGDAFRTGLGSGKAIRTGSGGGSGWRIGARK